MKHWIAALGVAVVVAVLVSGCILTPLASPQQDTLAKEFIAHPDASTIYIYRSPFNQHDGDSVLYLDGRILGMTRPATYYRIDTTPAAHTLHGTGSDIGQLMIETRPGQLYFVSHEVIGGHSTFRLVPEESGRDQIRKCCALLESIVTPRGTVLR